MRSLLPVALCITLSLAGCDLLAASSPQVASPEELQRSASANAGAFVAADEVCVGEGDLSASLARATGRGWKEFEPAPNSMMSRLRDIHLDGDDLRLARVVMVRKDENRAQILLTQVTTLTGSRYIHDCQVIEQAAEGLDEQALRTWAAVPIETRQVEDSPVYFDLKGGRFAGNVSADAYFVPRGSNGNEPAEGLIVAFTRSNLPAGGEE